MHNPKKYCTFAAAMSTNVEQILYRIDRTAGKILNGAVYAMLVLALLAGGRALLHLDAPLTLVRIYKYLWIACGIIAGVCVLCRIVLAPFVKSEEQEIFEQKVAYVLHQKQSNTPQMVSPEYSPLHDLLPEQEEKVKQILRNLPPNQNKTNQINLALVSRYLTALERMNLANLDDKHSLRLWVKNVTKKEVPSSSQFNEAIPNTNKKEVSKIKDLLERSLNDF